MRRIKRRVPTLVAMTLNPTYEMSQLAALLRLRTGAATVEQLDVLIDCRNLLALGANKRNEPSVTMVADMASVTVREIRERYENTGAITATEDDLQTLHAMIDVSQDFWRRQGGGTFTECHNELTDSCNKQGHDQEAIA
ncbi:MAG TPA: hypothetical protein VGK09_08210 [Rhodocyclaceae bacterium]